MGLLLRVLKDIWDEGYPEAEGVLQSRSSESLDAVAGIHGMRLENQDRKKLTKDTNEKEYMH